MCPECEGLGFVQALNINTLIDKNKSLLEGAIRFPTFQPGGWRLTRYTLSGYFDNDKKLKDFSGKEWEMLLYAPEHKPKHPHKDWEKPLNMKESSPELKKHS